MKIFSDPRDSEIVICSGFARSMPTLKPIQLNRTYSAGKNFDRLPLFGGELITEAGRMVHDIS